VNTRIRVRSSSADTAEPGADPDPPCRNSRDGGFSLVEMLVSVVLLGLTVTAVLATMRVTIRASVVDRDHAVAFEWLQSASDEIYRDPRVPCTSGRPAAIAAYHASAQSVVRPPMWDATAATIAVIDVEYLGKNSPSDDFEWAPGFCFEGAGYVTSPLYTQRVTLQVTSPRGDIVETLEMVKSQ
jgi:prepilin-type N-terminal cleavage/methylation domain-containing protein